MKLLSRAEIPDYAKDITEPLVDIVLEATLAERNRIKKLLPEEYQVDTEVGTPSKQTQIGWNSYRNELLRLLND